MQNSLLIKRILLLIRGSVFVVLLTFPSSKKQYLTTHDPTLYFRHLIHYSKLNKLNIQDTYPAVT